MNTQPVVIDVIGTAKGLVVWAIKQVLLLIGIILLGLSAPLLYTVGAELAIMNNPHSVQDWGVAYTMLGPVFCAIWMVFICHWHSVRQAQRAGNLKTWRRDNGGLFHTAGKSTLFMIGGFFGSCVTTAIFVVLSQQFVPYSPSKETLMVAFAIFPLFIFAPVWLVLLRRYIKRDEYAVA